MGQSLLRCFAAVEVASPSVRRALEMAQLGLKRAFGPGDPVKWVPAHQFHFTLRFFGEIDEALVRRAEVALDQAAAETSPFDLEVSGLGAFPDPARPSVVWCGVGHGRASLLQLAEKVEKAMRDAGVPKEARSFWPHLTLGRVRANTSVPSTAAVALRETRSYGSWRVKRLLLLRSELLPSGPRYTPLHLAPLGGGTELEE